MKRTPLGRRTPLAPGERRSHNSTLRPVNPKTGGHRFPKNVDKAFRAWIRRHPCLLLFDRLECHTRCRHRSECAHVKTRGAGAPDVGQCVPLCPLAHRLTGWSIHRDGIKSFQARFGLDLAAIAARLGERYAAGNEPEGDPMYEFRLAARRPWPGSPAPGGDAEP